ncbi:6517_t:CDS:2 [Entrophospora sp. SA101]|nr:6517_t:CDS:2 [Entrophospora sp. SA101]CAJ0872312.1 5097_t:CDS:2 [Entrophospora sp. SA101]
MFKRSYNPQPEGFRGRKKKLEQKKNLGVSADSGVSIGDGSVETKLVGVGFKVGKEIGISTPIGGVSIDLENFLQIFLISF